MRDTGPTDFTPMGRRVLDLESQSVEDAWFGPSTRVSDRRRAHESVCDRLQPSVRKIARTFPRDCAICGNNLERLTKDVSTTGVGGAAGSDGNSTGPLRMPLCCVLRAS